MSFGLGAFLAVSNEWVQMLVSPLRKKGNLKQCQDYRTISLNKPPQQNHAPNYPQPIQGQGWGTAGRRTSSRSTVEQILNSRVLTEKHLQHQHVLFYKFIDSKKAFEGVWHAGLWKVLRSFNTDESLVQAIKAQYENSSSALLLNSQLGEFFKTTVCVCKGCLLSPIQLNLFLEKIMQETLHDHHTSISFDGRPICNLRFADDIDLLVRSSGELQDLTNRLVGRPTIYGTEVGTEKSKTMTNGTNNTSADISMTGRKSVQVPENHPVQRWLPPSGSPHQDCLKWPKLKRIWWCNTISFASRFKLYEPLITSILLYG